jgi:hypothetical protein
MTDKARPSEAYESYEGFLRAAIRTYWERGAKSKVNFLALLFASREAWQVAWDKAATPEAGKKILTGAAGAAALGILLRVVVGGPIGILLTGASIASLVAIYVKNHARIWAKVERYKALIDENRPRFEEIRIDWVEGGIKDAQRDLMVDGLMSRFLADLDAFEPSADDEEGADEGEEKFSFASHLEKKKNAEEKARSDEAREKEREKRRSDEGGDDE